MKISVYIISYNQKQYLIEAIESVLNQTLEPVEIIIVDDCSTDGSQEVIEKYAIAHPDLIRPFFHEQCLGIPRNRNFALEQVRGDLVTYLDGDDRFLSRKLEMELETYLNHPEAQIVFSNVYYIDSGGQPKGLWFEGNSSPPTGNVFREAFAREFPKGSLFRNELVDYQCLKEAGFYDARFAMYSDWDLKIRLTKRFKVAYCHKPLSEYRLHQGGISRSVPSRHFDVMKRIYLKNVPLLDDLPQTDCEIIDKKLSAIFARLTKQSFAEELKRGNRMLALRFWIYSFRYNPKDFNLRSLAQFILPQRVYSKLKTVYHSFSKLLSL